MESVWQQIDLNRHAFIEASAGTGKTYTLERIVLRILIEDPKVKLDNLLIVTYTDKAALDLKTRIRQLLKEVIHTGVFNNEIIKSETRLRLKSQLLDFDAAHISTIHGFCHRYLSDILEDQGWSASIDLCVDSQFYDELVFELTTKYWPQRWGGNLNTELGLSDIYVSIEDWSKDLCAIASEYREEPFDELYTCGDDWALATQVQEKLKGEFDKGFLEQYESSGVQKRSLESRMRFLNRLKEAVFLDLENSSFSLKALQLLRENIQDLTFARNQGYQGLLKGIKEGDEFYKVCEAFIQFADDFEKYCLSRAMLIARDSVQWLKRRIIQLKQEISKVSFDDFLIQFFRVLKSPNSPFLEQLQNQYKVAFVDEFQDTDPIQWSIFKEIFINSKFNHRLFLIGDPKQSIYSFRGADLKVYFKASQQIDARYSLNHNFRTGENLLKALNHLFNHPIWFEGQKAIQYQKNECGKDLKQAGSCGLYGMDLSHTKVQDSGEANDVIAKAIVSRLCQLREENEEEFNLSKFAVLVEKREAAKNVIKYCHQAGIPVSLYKDRALLKSNEAIQIRCLLRAMAFPSDRSATEHLLLSRFFLFTPQELQKGTDRLAHSYQLINEWSSLLEKGNWSCFVESCLKDSTLKAFDAQFEDAERRRSNIKQLLEMLSLWALGEGLSIKSCWEKYEQLLLEGGEDIYELKRKDSDSSSLQILTFHASKGLEFDVVFIADGFSGMQSHFKKALPWRVENKPRTLEIFSGKFYGKEVYKNELEQEKRRLWYVAMTRAKSELYIPIGYHPKRKSDCALLNFVQPVFEDLRKEQVLDSIQILDLSQSEYLKISKKSSVPILNNEVRSWEVRKVRAPVEKMTVVQSFSDLHREFRLVPTEQKGDEEIRNDSNIEIDNDAEGYVKAGLTIGRAFHEWMEILLRKLDSINDQNEGDRVLKDLFSDELDQVLNKHQLGILQLEEIGYLELRQAFSDWGQRTIDLEVEGFKSLRSFSSNDFHCEQDFFLDATKVFDEKQARFHREFFLKGSIDCILETDRGFHIMDWKTNQIPLSETHGLMDCIRSHQYDLQLKLYALAWKNLLERFGIKKEILSAQLVFVRHSYQNKVLSWELPVMDIHDWQQSLRESVDVLKESSPR